MTMRRMAGAAGLLAVTLLSTGCVTATVDEMVFNEPTEGLGDSTVVILGRRHASDYETEPDFIGMRGGPHFSARQVHCRHQRNRVHQFPVPLV